MVLMLTLGAGLVASFQVAGWSAVMTFTLEPFRVFFT